MPAQSAHRALGARRSSFTPKNLADHIKYRFLQDRIRARQHARASAVDSQSPGASSSTIALDDWGMGEAALDTKTDAHIPLFEGITLPRQLRRPPLREPSKDALTAIDPNLADTNVEFVKSCLELSGEDLFDMVKRTSIVSAQKMGGPGSLPSSVRVRVSDAHSELPTHYLAVSSSRSDGSDLATASSDTSATSNVKKVTMIPVHSIILAIFTPAVGALQPSKPTAQLPDCFAAGQSTELDLPTHVLAVPSPLTFAMLLSVLYTQRYDNLLRVILGVPLLPLAPHPQPQASTTSAPVPAPSQSALFSKSVFAAGAAATEPYAALTPPCIVARSLSALIPRVSLRTAYMSRQLAAAFRGDGIAVLRRIRLAQALAANACALGVCDANLWGALDVAWAVLLGALGVCAGGAPGPGPAAP